MKNYVFILVFLVPGFCSWAEDQSVGVHALTTPQEREIRLRAKKRLYPGGRDEESLKVQAQLPVVTRKIAPVTELPAEEAPADNDSATD